MALKLSFPFPIFAPPHAPTAAPIQNHRSPTEIRVSRWTNAGKFSHHKRAAPELEDETRRNHRSVAVPETSGDAGTETSRATRPGPWGRKSRFSRNPNLSKLNSAPHQAFRRQSPAKIDGDGETLAGGKASVSVSDSGVSYVVEGAPFEFKYSYTETPKVRPLRLREASFTPFGPATVPRPWTGQKPLPPSKKKAREFDSFKLPPPGKKGVKPVQAPGPFLQGSGPKYTRSREEIMGEPLTKEEIKEMVNSCIKVRRQLNMGRDGLTHNMLENIHALWKRRRICKIRCMGVCTVDMDNVCQQLEEKTGGKIIQRSGGTLYLFRGRNYNYKTRPRYPLMLWKPAAPLYPKLIKRIPEGLTLEEATEMRKKGSKLIPICKLAKNGAYYDLVNNVREAFEECELIRINCQGLNTSDFHKIGAKLQDLVPCVLISFEEEHILVWRGQNWKSSFPEPEVDLKVANNSSFDGVTSISPPSEAEELSSSHISTVSVKDASPTGLNASIPVMNLRDVSLEGIEGPISTEVDSPHAATDTVAIVGKTPLCETISDNTLCIEDQPTALTNAGESATIFTNTGSGDEESVAVSSTNVYDSILDNTDSAGDDPAIALAEAATISDIVGSSSYMLESSIAGHMNDDKMQDISEALHDLNQPGKSSTACTNGILRLWRQAVDGGSAVVLDNANLDADLVFKEAVAFAQVAPPGPVFKHIGPRKVEVDVQDGEKKETGDSEMKEVREVVVASHKKRPDKKSSKLQKKKDSDDLYLDVVTQGSLAVDELAKLLA